MKIILRDIEKKFNEEVLFRKLHYEFHPGSSTALLGINGSGKSTLLQIIAAYITPGKGRVLYIEQDQEMDEEERFRHVSICAPYLELIEELTLSEFLHYHFAFKRALLPINEMITLLGLQKAKNKPIEKFSSGMKQRVKLAQAVLSDTKVLLLDEPCTNLDGAGVQLYHDLINRYTHDRIVVVASNDATEYSFCKDKLQVQTLKPQHVS